MSKAKWSKMFAPSYTPEEMIKLGIFEGTYMRAIKGLPSKWKAKGKVLRKGQEPDVSINKYGVKSRLSLSKWKSNGWIMTDPGGWFEWYCNYFKGRRLGNEDIKQINRWRSFVARHQGAISKAEEKGSQKGKRLKQRQGLLQWGWDDKKSFNSKQLQANINRLKKMGIEFDE